MKSVLLKSLLFLTLFLLSIASCTKARLEKKETVSNFELSLRGSAAIITKAEDLLPKGTAVGIYVPFRDSLLESAKSQYSNRLYTSDSSGVLSGGPVMLTIEKDYDIYGYAPYQKGVLSPESITGFKNGDDVLLAKKATIINVSQTNFSADLSFVHIVSQISFNVVCEDPDLLIDNTSLIEITGFYQSAELNIKNATLSPSGLAPSTIVNGANGKLVVNPSCFFTNNAGTMNLSIKVTIGGEVYNGIISKLFVAGESYKYTVTIPLSKQEIKFTATLAPWVQREGDVIVSND